MVIYIWADGSWEYSWEDTKSDRRTARSVNLDKWFDYDLNEKEALACLEALEE